MPPRFLNSRFLKSLLTLIALVVSLSTSYGKTIITGSISAADADEVSIQVYEKYLNNTFKEYKIKVVSRQFRIENLPITEPRFVTLVYKGKKTEFFVAPNDSLSLTIDSENFPRTRKRCVCRKRREKQRCLVGVQWNFWRRPVYNYV